MLTPPWTPPSGLIQAPTNCRPGLTQPLSLLPDNPESEAPVVQDTPAEDPAETQPAEEEAEQPDGAFAKRPNEFSYSGHCLTLLTRCPLPREDRPAPRRPAVGASSMLTAWNILARF